MIMVWYGAVSFMLITYVVLDGRNFGAGMLIWFVARTPEERRQVLAAIGPLWTWHEVWLLGFGGTLFAVFPRLMASAFPGYYLALFLILWCLILRGVSMEIGGHIKDRLWQAYWDCILAIASFLLAIVFGVAAGNEARGVPVDRDGNFSMAFFSDFSVRGNVGLLDWYTVSVAIFGVVVLAAHGATYLGFRTEGPLHERCQRSARGLWTAAIPLLLVVLPESLIVRPDLPGRAIQNPFWWLGLVGSLVAAICLALNLAKRHELRAHIASSLLIAGMLATGSAAIFPVMLQSTLEPSNSLTAYDLAASPMSLRIAAFWWPIALALSLFYSASVSRRYAGKVGAGPNP